MPQTHPVAPLWRLVATIVAVSLLVGVFPAPALAQVADKTAAAVDVSETADDTFDNAGDSSDREKTSQDGDNAGTTKEPGAPQSAAEAYQRAMALARLAGVTYEEQDYRRTLEVCDQVLAIANRAADVRLLKARCWIQLDDREEALAELRLAVQDGLTGVEKLDQPPLDRLADDAQFAALREAVVKADERVARGMEAKPVEVPGTRIIQGDPEDGFPWRMRISPDATAESPQRLLIWLHPSGGSMNDSIERISPFFIEQGFAVAMVAAKPWRYWRGKHIQTFLKHTLPDIASVEEVDARKPVLFGYSAGGQAAMEMWLARPAAYGGLILDAAYPTDMAYYRKTKGFRLFELPEAGIDDQTPFFVLVGSRDPGAELWKEAQRKWQEKLPLEVIYVEGAGHTWLLGREQMRKLRRWLNNQVAPLTAASAP